MTLFAIAFGSSVVGFIISKILCDREAQKVAQAEKTKTQLDEGKHLLIVEERDSQVQSLIKQNDLLKEKLELSHNEVRILEQKIEISKIKLQEIEKEKELLYINKVDEQLKEHSQTVLEKYIEPLQEKIVLLKNTIENNKENESALISEEIKKMYLSNVEFRQEVIKQFENSTNNIQKHITDRIKSTRPPRHIICGSLT
jgi:hypothetical protein